MCGTSLVRKEISNVYLGDVLLFSNILSVNKHSE